MKNPTKPLRIAYITALAGISVPVWDRRVPKDLDPEPELYVLVTSQTVADFNRTKCGNTSTDCTVLLQVIYKKMEGYADSVPVDDVIDEILRKININAQLVVTGFRVLDTELASSSVDDAFEFDTQTVIRGLVRFRHLVAEA